MSIDGRAFSIDYSDLQKAAYSFEQGPKIMQRETLKGMRLAVEDTRKITRQGMPYKSGKLQANMPTSVIQRASNVEGQIKAAEKYAIWANDGRGPVRPVNKKFLRFRIDGKEIFTKFVKAFAGYHFMEKGLAASQTAITRAMDNAADRVTRFLTGTGR